MWIILWLFVGLLGAGLFLLLIGKLPDKLIHQVCAIALIVAALIYIVFALIYSDFQWQWLWLESVGVIIYGLLAWLSFRVSAYLLAVGWLLHPVWDLGVHIFGPINLGLGRSIAPESYVLACLSFDIVIAVFIFRRAKDW